MGSFFRADAAEGSPACKVAFGLMVWVICARAVAGIGRDILF